MARGDVSGAVLRATRTGGIKKAIPRRLSLLIGKDVFGSLANELRERLGLARREHFQTLVLVWTELNLCANHDGMLALVCIHDAYFCGHFANPASVDPEEWREGLPRIDVEVGDVMGGVVIRTPVD